MSSNLKITAGKIITKSDKFTRESKIQLLNFLESANDHQVKAFLLDGDIVAASDDVAKQIIDDRWASSPLSKSGD